MWWRACGWVLLVSVAAASPSAPSVASSLTPRDAQYLYLAELSEALAHSPEPRHLMIAARLRQAAAHDLRRASVSREMLAQVAARSVHASSEALVREALRRDPGDPLLWWIVANDCPASAAACDVDEALRRLRALVPDNAAVWMISLAAGTSTADAAHMQDAGIDEALQRVAEATDLDLYLGEQMRSYFDAFAQRPLPEAAVEGDMGLGEEPSVAMARDVLAFGFALAEAIPPLDGMVRHCSEHAAARHGPQRRQRCEAAYRAVLRQADSVLAHHLAARGLLRLLPPGEERQAVERERRRVAWQTVAFGELVSFEPGQPSTFGPDLAGALVALWRTPSATELSVMRDLLTIAGVSLDPPHDWNDARTPGGPPVASNE